MKNPFERRILPRASAWLALLTSACAASGTSVPDAAPGSQDGGPAIAADGATATADGSISDGGGGAGHPDSSVARPDSSVGDSAGATIPDGSTAVDGGSSTSGPGSYALPAPRQCDNQTYVKGCQQGVASTPCNGICQAANACENISSKPNADVGFICPRFLLFGDEMLQAAKDDWGSAPPFNYAIVGHNADMAGIDGNVATCCQCYELVFDRPSPSMDNEGCVNADCTQGSAVPVPPPLIVQAFDFGAPSSTFDVFMGAGGFGANNACDPNGSPTSQSGKYLYTAFAPDGEPNGGGVKVTLQDAPWPADCKTNLNYITTATVSSAVCQGEVAAECAKIQAAAPNIAAETVRSCTQADSPASFYHLNWQVYAKKVECPTHLTEVTGCKLAAQGLPAAQPAVTASQAAADSTWRMYGTTTMQDCCKPSCAWQDFVTGMGLTAIQQYNSFYTCDQNGVPVTE